jgi:hypothetical protein
MSPQYLGYKEYKLIIGRDFVIFYEYFCNESIAFVYVENK